jgi:hypothetical protein
MCFLLVFFSVFLRYFVVSLHVCLSVLCCYLLSVLCNILNIGLLGSMALSFICRLFLYNLCM